MRQPDKSIFSCIFLCLNQVTEMLNCILNCYTGTSQSVFLSYQENCSSANISLGHCQHRSQVQLVNNALSLEGLPIRVPPQTGTAWEYKQCMHIQEIIPHFRYNTPFVC